MISEQILEVRVVRMEYQWNFIASATSFDIHFDILTYSRYGSQRGGRAMTERYQSYYICY